jgi:hypothetical protein
MILTWLLHSMLPEISQGYLFFCTAREVWDATTHTYSKMENARQIYELKQQIHGAIQGDWSVTTYFHKLCGL